MPLLEPQYTNEISSSLELKNFQVQSVLDLTKEGSTVPFIARYRKEATGDLDEKEIRAIIELQSKIETLYKAKLTALSGIAEQGKLTPELEASIIACQTLKAVEDIYKPYRLKKKTKAMIALEKGFGVVAEYLVAHNSILIPEDLLAKYPREEILEGVIEIIAADITRRSDLREWLSDEMMTYGLINSKKKSEKMLEKIDPNAKKQIFKFDTYAEFSRSIKLIKPYQTLALGRGENLGILTVNIDLSDETIDLFSREVTSFRPIELYQNAILQGFKTLSESVENEIRGELTETAELDAVETFSKNL